MTKITAPFTVEQVKGLNRWQASHEVHPFTCGGDRRDLAHVQYARQSGQGDMGILIAATDGWRCPVCDYRQDWAHDFMTLPIPPYPIAPLPPPPPEPVTGKPRGKRGFAAMDPDRRRQIAAKGGASVPNEKRSFAKDRELARTAGRKGGEANLGRGQEK